jgi:tRNA pseudouridine38-40 synthase
MMQKRFLVEIQYVGTRYSGWSFQKKNGRTPPGIAALMTEKIEQLFGAGNYSNFAGSSRTDRGVHAIRNFFHVDINDKCLNSMNGNIVARALNHRLLDEEVKILSCREVHPDFDCRRKAISRTYIYRLICSPTNRYDKKTWLFQDNTAWNIRKVDISKMEDAALHMTGIHDFSSFRNSNCQSLTPYRYVHSIVIKNHTNPMYATSNDPHLLVTC